MTSPVLNSDVYGTDGSIVITAAAKDYAILDSRGQEILKRPFIIPRDQKIGLDKGTPAGGDVGCIMCYDSVFSWSYRASEGRKRLAGKPNVSPGTNFCSGAEGHGLQREKQQAVSSVWRRRHGPWSRQLQGDVEDQGLGQLESSAQDELRRRLPGSEPAIILIPPS